MIMIRHCLFAFVHGNLLCGIYIKAFVVKTPLTMRVIAISWGFIRYVTFSLELGLYKLVSLEIPLISVQIDTYSGIVCVVTVMLAIVDD